MSVTYKSERVIDAANGEEYIVLGMPRVGRRKYPDLRLVKRSDGTRSELRWTNVRSFLQKILETESEVQSVLYDLYGMQARESMNKR